MFIKHLFNNKLLKTNQTNSCEFIFLFAAICIDETTLISILIYYKNLHDLQDIRLEGFDYLKKTHFIVSKKNWG